MAAHARRTRKVAAPKDADVLYPLIDAINTDVDTTNRPSSRSAASAQPAGSAWEDRLVALRPDELSPRDALAVLYELKAMMSEKS